MKIFITCIVLLCITSATQAEAVLTSDISIGSKNDSVKELQRFLISQKLLTGDASGYFGNQTLKSVQKFQTREGLKPTGYVGQLTRLRVNMFLQNVSGTKASSVQLPKKIDPHGTICSALPLRALPRTTTDRPDDFAGHQVHFVYVLPSDSPDEQLDTNGTIVRSVNAFAQWFCKQTNGVGLKIDTAGGALDVTFIRLSSPDSELLHGTTLPWKVNPDSNPYTRDDLERRLPSFGLDDSKKIYAVYYGGTSNTSCGGGPWPPELIGRVAALYVHGSYGNNPAIPRCETNPFASSVQKPGYREFSMLHEIFHTLGMVPSCAPHHTLRGHTSDSTADIMYQGDGHWDYDHLTIDVNHDDYYKASIPGCQDLSASIFLSPGGTTLPKGW